MSLATISCASSPSEPEVRTIEVTETRVLTPPARFLEPCAIERVDRTLGAELERLARLVECERADKAAIVEWAASADAPSPESP